MLFWSIFLPLIAVLFVLYFQYFGRIFQGKKAVYLIEEGPEALVTSRELRNTLLNLVVFALVGLLIGFSVQNGWTKAYNHSARNWVDISYYFLAFFAAIFIHDFYFYLTHRLLHLPFVYKKVHYWHHKSLSVNAWSAFSFHPIEGIFQIGIVLLVVFIIPIHTTVLAIFSGFLLFMSVYGHCGYELRPNKLKAFNVFNTSFHHAQHHKFIRYNFGIYSTIWDNLFKSNHPQYSKNFEELAAKINQKKAASINSNRGK